MVFEGIDIEAVRSELASLGLDGWLLYDFHGCNPVAKRVIGFQGFVSRRLFVLIPREGRPIALVHQIEQHPVAGFPGEVLIYRTWQDLHEKLAILVKDRRLAMEISEQDAVPYLDRIPYGVFQLVTQLGGTPAGSADLVTAFASVWSSQELADHQEAAELIASIARLRLSEAVIEVGTVTEVQLQQRVIDDIGSDGLAITDAPIVAFGANSANPHYEPGGGGERVLGTDEVVLLDLWAGREGSVFADQTWMGFSGREVPSHVAEVWEAVSGARDAVLQGVRGVDYKALMGKDLDEIARGYLRDRGLDEFFVHRTGHSIDIELHGSGPHLDGFETQDTRRLRQGIGFSVEPGVYLAGDFGVRSEVNVYLGEGGPVVTPARLQCEIVVPK